MMDISDGLVLDASRLAAASGVTVLLEGDRLGRDVADALSGGEDHALLACFPQDVPLPPGFRRIGRIGESAAHPVLLDGAAPAGRGGWDPYRDWDAHRG
jgi:thiamine-monophosphate kinase